MGAVVSKTTDGIGNHLLEKTLLAPFKTMFDGSCQECSGPWDMVCFIEHLCVTNLLKLLMILVLCYITLLFFYLVFKLGIFQCIGKSLCKMCWVACETYWLALRDICCFLWYKLRNTTRINRRRRRHRHQHHFRDIEEGYSSSVDDLCDNYHNLSVSRKRKSLSRRRRNSVTNSVHCPSRRGSRRHHHRDVMVKTRSGSVRAIGNSLRLKSARRVKISQVKDVRSKNRTSKRRRLR